MIAFFGRGKVENSKHKEGGDMAKTIVKRTGIEPDFAKKLDGLEKAAGALEDASRRLTGAFITFAVGITAMWKEAKGLDKGTRSKLHEQAVLKRGGFRGTVLDKATLSKWKAIASHAADFRQIEDVVPPHRDTLYWIATRATQSGKSVIQLVRDKSINPTSGVSELKALAAPSAPKSKGGRKKTRQENASVGEIFGKAFTPISVGISAGRLPQFVQVALENQGYVWIKIKAEHDPDTGKNSLFATEFTVRL